MRVQAQVPLAVGALNVADVAPLWEALRRETSDAELFEAFAEILVSIQPAAAALATPEAEVVARATAAAAANETQLLVAALAATSPATRIAALQLLTSAVDVAPAVVDAQLTEASQAAPLLSMLYDAHAAPY
ncbi:MAG: hypothetical protein EOO41_02790, partial [Methanobacteriota archaeon]